MDHPEPLITHLQHLNYHNPIEARRQLADARANNPRNEHLENQHIRHLLHAYDIRAVVRASRHALAKHQTPTLLFWLGGALLYCGRPRAALAPLTEAARLAPDPRHLDMLARCQHHLGVLSDAIMTYSHLITLLRDGLTRFHSAVRGLAAVLPDVKFQPAWSWRSSRRTCLVGMALGSRDRCRRRTGLAVWRSG